ncbi:hypothetical protein VYU27_009563 [Nannochloropsis oceanica]
MQPGQRWKQVLNEEDKGEERCPYIKVSTLTSPLPWVQQHGVFVGLSLILSRITTLHKESGDLLCVKPCANRRLDM